jgi:lysophospholipase L1-like esterase
MNDLIKPMVRSEGAALADGYAAMADSANLAGLFSDHIHPNDDGYRLLAQAFFRAITNPAQTP